MMTYFTFQQDIFGCNSSTVGFNVSKPIIIFQVFNTKTMENITSTYAAVIKNPNGDTNCNFGCLFSAPLKGCYCEQLTSSLFDVKSQLQKVFEDTNVAKIFNISISEWRIYDSV